MPPILAIGAHPDDLEFGVGGVLLTELAAGSALSLAITSRGESSSHGTPEQRVAEATSAADQLDCADRLTVLDFGGDGQQTASPENAVQLARLIRATKPSIVLAPLPEPNQHPDHSVVGHATRDACRLARYDGLEALRDTPPHTIDSLWFYAITPSPERSLTGAILVDISAVVDAWRQLMAYHQSQTSARHYVDLQLARARQLGLLAGCEYATALWPNDPPVLTTLAPLSRTARGF